jgi:hypothetical protein
MSRPTATAHRRSRFKLFQFQCQREGTLFYYQSGMQYASSLFFVGRCPVCGSKRVQPTGRTFTAINEDRPLKAIEKKS